MNYATKTKTTKKQQQQPKPRPTVNVARAHAAVHAARKRIAEHQRTTRRGGNKLSGGRGRLRRRRNTNRPGVSANAASVPMTRQPAGEHRGTKYPVNLGSVHRSDPKATQRWSQQLRSMRTTCEEPGEDRGDVPIVEHRELPGEMEHPEPKLGLSDEHKPTISGSEFIGKVTIPAGLIALTIPSGGCIFWTHLNLLGLEGSRISKMAEMYKIWRPHSLVLEYVPMVPATEPGSLTGFCSPDIDENASLIEGDDSLRLALSREGASSVQVWQHHAFYLGHRQQDWYFASPQEDAHQSFPGYFQLNATTDVTAPISTAKTFGLMWMHYVVEFDYAGMEEMTVPSLTTDKAGLALGGLAQTQYNPISAIMGAFLIPSAFQNDGVVGWGTVVHADDSGPGSNTWRTWMNPDTGETVTIEAGMVLFFRYCSETGGSPDYRFYPNLPEALDGSFDAGNSNMCSWVASVTVTPTAPATLSLINISGMRVDQEM